MLISSVFAFAAVCTVLVPDVGGLKCYDCIGGRRGTDDLGCLTSEPNPETLKEFKGESVMCLTVFVTTEIAGANDTLTIRTSRNESGRYRDGECTDNFPEFQAIFMSSHVYGCFCSSDECNRSNVSSSGPSLMVLLASLWSLMKLVSLLFCS